MAFQLKIDNSKLEGKEAPPAGIYQLRFIEFNPKRSALKPGEAPDTIKSLNLNAKMEIVNNADEELNGRFVYEGLNENAGWVMQDFAHAFGFPLETDGVSSWIPGMWEGDPNDAKTLVYKGPLIGQIANVEIVNDSYNNKVTAKVARYVCRVPDCTQKFPTITHSLNLQKKK
jgi:hypothetical protein